MHILAITYCFYFELCVCMFLFYIAKFRCFLHTLWQIKVIFLGYLSFISFFAVNLTHSSTCLFFYLSLVLFRCSAAWADFVNCWKDHRTNASVRRMKLQYFGHRTRPGLGIGAHVFESMINGVRS